MAAVAKNPVASGGRFGGGSPGSEGFLSGAMELADLFSKLNPAAEEFIPSSRLAAAAEETAAAAAGRKSGGRLSADAPIFVSNVDYYGNIRSKSNGGNTKDSIGDGSSENKNNTQPIRRRRNGYGTGCRRMSERALRARRDESIRRTVYVSDIDQQVTEEVLADIFSACGQVVDCRVCGDVNSALRFAFVEFAEESGAKAALDLGGTMLGYYPVRVLPSKTAILPVNPSFLPRSEDEKEMVSRTVHCTNIGKEITEIDIKGFFDSVCGEVSRLRLLGDNTHSACIAFVEFAQAECALMALNCSGMHLGKLPIRVSPSKTPVRPRSPRATTGGAALAEVGLLTGYPSAASPTSF